MRFITESKEKTSIRKKWKMMNKKPLSSLPPAQEWGGRARSRNGKAGNGPV
jgi:hypothetical protein